MHRQQARRVWLILLLVIGLQVSGSVENGGERRAKYPVRILTRNGTRRCLKDATPPTRGLTISTDRKVPVSVAYANWASARILGEIVCILLSETMGYNAHLLDTATLFSAHPVNYAAGKADISVRARLHARVHASKSMVLRSHLSRGSCVPFGWLLVPTGCVDADSEDCPDGDINDPLVHLTVETWMAGTRRAALLPQERRPQLLRVMDYNLDDQYFIWPNVLQTGLAQSQQLSLDFWRSYQAPNRAFRFFTPWRTVLEYARSNNLIVNCTAQVAQSPVPRNEELYKRITHDDSVDCLEDQVWLSPACRGSRSTLNTGEYLNTSECVPLIIQYTVDFAMQISFFLKLPFAVILVGAGAKGDYAEYYELIRKHDVVFGWYTPDDNLVRVTNGSPELPVMINMPRTNKYEHENGIYKTGLANFQVREVVAVILVGMAKEAIARLVVMCVREFVCALVVTCSCSDVLL